MRTYVGLVVTKSWFGTVGELVPGLGRIPPKIDCGQVHGLRDGNGSAVGIRDMGGSRVGLGPNHDSIFTTVVLGSACRRLQQNRYQSLRGSHSQRSSSVSLIGQVLVLVRRKAASYPDRRSSWMVVGGIPIPYVS